MLTKSRVEICPVCKQKFEILHDIVNYPYVRIEIRDKIYYCSYSCFHKAEKYKGFLKISKCSTQGLTPEMLGKMSDKDWLRFFDENGNIKNKKELIKYLKQKVEEAKY